jgi:hypothetical protein
MKSTKSKVVRIATSKLLGAIVLLGATATLVTAQKVSVYASGLKNPTKVIETPSGSLLVSETDTTPNSGRVSRIVSGVVHPLFTGLPSGLSAPNGDPDGPSGLILAGQVLYIEIGEGDGFANAARRGQEVPNPAGVSSPIFASIIKVTLSAGVDAINGTFAMAAADQSNLELGKSVTLMDGAGNSAVCSILTLFRTGIPDPNNIWRNSHPYAMTTIDSQPSSIYVADAGRNLVWQVDNTSGKYQALTQFAPTPDPIAGPPVIEAVPENIHQYGNQLLVTLLSGAPFVGGQSRVISIDPATGAQTLFISLLSSVIDVGYVPIANARPTFYALEYSANLSAGAAGELLRYDTTVGDVYVSGLKGPTSMAVDPSGMIYVAEHDGGDILLITP